MLPRSHQLKYLENPLPFCKDCQLNLKQEEKWLHSNHCDLMHLKQMVLGLFLGQKHLSKIEK
jgi:hypothetical protein